MHISVDSLVSRIHDCLCVEVAFDPTEPRAPFHEFRYLQAVHACAASAQLLKTSSVPFLRELAGSFAQLGGQSELASAKKADVESVARQTLEDIATAHAAACEDTVALFDQAQRLPVKLRRLQQLTWLGETERAEALLAGLAATDERNIFATSQLLLRSKGMWREADIRARRLFSSDPDFVIESGEPPRFLFLGNGALPELSLPTGTDEWTVKTFAFHSKYLTLQDRFDDALQLAQAHSDVSPLPKGVAANLAIMLGRLDLSGEQRDDLQTIQYLPIIPIQADLLDPREWFSRSVHKAARQKTSPHVLLELASWAVSLLASAERNEAHRRVVPDLNCDLYALALPARNDSIRDALLADGFHPISPNAVHRQFPMGRDDDWMSESAISRSQTKRAAQFLKEATTETSGTVLFSFHASSLQGRDLLATIAASRSGLSVISHSIGSTISGNNSSATQALARSEHPAKMVGRTSTPTPQATSDTLAHLKMGGLLDIAMDVVVSSGVTMTIPWFLRPISVPTYPSAMAISQHCKVGISATWRAASGALTHDIVSLSLPPNQGDIATRALWLTQKIGRASRAFAREAAIPISSPLMVPRGGTAGARDLLSLDEWSAQRGVSSGLTSWLADPNHGAQRDALRMSAGAVAFGALHKLTLQMASVLLHYQTEKPEHTEAKRNFVDQHRVMLVLPQGPVFMASALAGLAVGSMVGLSQDDLTIDQLGDRYREFKPDLMIVTATAWARLLAANPDISRQTVLIVDDRGNQVALEDLVFSFSPAQKLPKVCAGASGLVIFTSGSTGKPKGVVHPADALSLDKAGHGIGADLLFELSPTDKLTYVARWDSVCFLDILASLRGGTTVCVPDHKTLTSPGELGAWLTLEGVTCLAAPATVFGLLLQSGAMAQKRQPALRLTMPWGERISNDLTTQLYQKFPASTHIASYGASEALWVAIGRIPQLDDEAGSMACPGGLPIRGVEMTLVSETGDEVSQGETGHPKVSGLGVMLGYLDDLMAGNDAATHKPVILQDFARRSSDGALQLLGRSDSIIKIAGRRISLLEVEAAAEMAAGVREAIAVVSIDAQSSQVLVAVTRDDTQNDDIIYAIERSVAERCFASARPARILVLDDFPRLASGKRDRKAVEKQFRKDARSEAATTKNAALQSRATAAPLSEKITEWAVLRLHIKASDFDPMGAIPPLDSLMIMELLLLAEEVCGAILPGSVFSQHRGLKWAGLVAEIEKAAGQVEA